MHDLDYLNFYKERLVAGDTVILDNGAYEDEQPDYKLYFECIQELIPTYFVLPDDPGDFRSSSMMSLDFIKYIQNKGIGNAKRLWVCHAKDGDLQNFVSSYELGATNADGICFSRLTKSYGTAEEVSEMRRVQFVDHLKSIKKWDPTKYHHCLGQLAGSLRELPYLNARGIDSIDSSAPVWRGLMGYKLGEVWPDFPLVMHPAVVATAPMDGTGKSAGEVLAQRNLDKVLAECRKEA